MHENGYQAHVVLSLCMQGRAGLVEKLKFSLTANNNFTKHYPLEVGTNNTHAPYYLQSCQTNTVGMKELCLFFYFLSKYLNIQKSLIIQQLNRDYKVYFLIIIHYTAGLQYQAKQICYCCSYFLQYVYLSHIGPWGQLEKGDWGQLENCTIKSHILIFVLVDPHS